MAPQMYFIMSITIREKKRENEPTKQIVCVLASNFSSHCSGYIEMIKNNYRKKAPVSMAVGGVNVSQTHGHATYTEKESGNKIWK